MKNIILIGFMGAGKTTLGKALAREKKYRFIDTDLYIEKEQKRRIKDIFAEDGEEYFRDLETEMLRRLLEKEEPMVIAVGGGLPVRKENRELLKSLGTVVYLTASVETLVRRLSGDTTRPKLQGGDVREKIISLMNAREKIYYETADLKYSVDHNSVKRAVQDLNRRFE